MRSLIYILLFTSIFTFINTALLAQEEQPEEQAEGWTKGAGIGLDFAQLLIINPKQGAGQNRIGLGGAANFFAKYLKNRVAWDNIISWNFGVQRLGSGVIAQGADEKIPFQKAIDELRLNSKIGYATAENSKFFYAADFSFLSQLTPTYLGTATYPGNFLTDISETSTPPLSKLFSPATINISLGMDYKPNENFSLFYSPLGGKFIIVADDDIAARGVHGNPVEGTPDSITGFYPQFDNTFSAFGSLLRLGYTDKYLEDQMAFTSSLALFSNYLENPQNIDVDWTNELAYTIAKGLQLAVTLNIFYDDDVKVQVTDYDAPNGIAGLGKRVSFTEQLLLKYNFVF